MRSILQRFCQWLAGVIERDDQRIMDNLFQKLEAKIETLPDGEDRNRLIEFKDKIEPTVHISKQHSPYSD